MGTVCLLHIDAWIEMLRQAIFSSVHHSNRTAQQQIEVTNLAGDLSVCQEIQIINEFKPLCINVQDSITSRGHV